MLSGNSHMFKHHFLLRDIKDLTELAIKVKEKRRRKRLIQISSWWDWQVERSSVNNTIKNPNRQSRKQAEEKAYVGLARQPWAANFFALFSSLPSWNQVSAHCVKYLNKHWHISAFKRACGQLKSLLLLVWTDDA